MSYLLYKNSSVVVIMKKKGNIYHRYKEVSAKKRFSDEVFYQFVPGKSVRYKEVSAIQFVRYTEVLLYIGLNYLQFCLWYEIPLKL